MNNASILTNEGILEIGDPGLSNGISFGPQLSFFKNDPIALNIDKILGSCARIGSCERIVVLPYMHNHPCSAS